MRIFVQIVCCGLALRRRGGQQDRAGEEPSKLELDSGLGSGLSCEGSEACLVAWRLVLSVRHPCVCEWGGRGGSLGGEGYPPKSFQVSGLPLIKDSSPDKDAAVSHWQATLAAAGLGPPRVEVEDSGHRAAVTLLSNLSFHLLIFLVFICLISSDLSSSLRRTFSCTPNMRLSFSLLHF